MGILRKVMIETRNRLVGREAKDILIREAFFGAVSKETERFFIYASCNGEVDTTGIIERLLADGNQVFCPKVLKNSIVFLRVNALSELAPGYHRIPEPILPELPEEELALYLSENAVFPSQENTDLMVLPGLVFDENGGRMGYGSGIYDRYLSQYPCRTLALAYEIQVNASPLSLKASDVRMDMLVTEKKVRTFGL